ncbi:hypothetical protein [Oryza sativa Japonica Group]|uniref:Uncharacterized protein n=2 Tax=Oryza sativa subsp. japonica TaxID=39947 RepID=Q5SNH6_ORYSJ|nr:hypothetical protein OsJ_00705 [Oryza sativa Japonica Group]BAD72227.1 hypothetical protein [Oryza sativa Japonica Group]BAD72230.1 hypothetical protein [Oryza sativa Japonica Group]
MPSGDEAGREEGVVVIVSGGRGGRRRRHCVSEVGQPSAGSPLSSPPLVVPLWLTALVGQVCAGESSPQGGQKREPPSSSPSVSASPLSPLRPAAFAPPGWTPTARVDLQQVWPSTSSLRLLALFGSGFTPHLAVPPRRHLPPLRPSLLHVSSSF